MFEERSENIPRIIVKTKYIKGISHKEYYVKYIATREGVEKFQMSHGDKPATKKQKELIGNLLTDYPDSKSIFEYEDYIAQPTRENASEFIASVMDQNITDVATKENYVGYIANRPRVERLGEHGLFSDEGKQIDLNRVAKVVGQHEGTVWTHIISLKRDDAERLGYDNARSWMDLCQAKRNDLAEAMRISPEELEWFAAFHNEGHHPHIHMIAYSKDPHKGFVTPEGIAKIRKMFAGEIFHQDLMHIYKGQTEVRDEVKHYSKDIVEKALRGLQDTVLCSDEKLLDKIKLLKESLQDYHGRLMYAYIPKESKSIIDDIVRDIEQEPHVHELYEQWLAYRQDIYQIYNGKLQERLPLHQQKEFKSIKHMILKEVMNCDEAKVIYDEQSDELENNENDGDPFDEQNFADDVQDDNVSRHATGYRLEWSKEYKKAAALFYGSSKIKQDIESAEVLLELECGKNNVLAFELLAKLKESQNKESVEASELYAEALKGSLSILAADGSEFVENYLQYKVGKFYYYGKGTEQDYEMAFQHFSKSDSQYAFYSLGTMYHRGYYVEQSDEKAFEYYERSANQGNPFANYEVGCFYDRGTAVVKDKEKANQYYERAYGKFQQMLDKQEDDNLLYRIGEMTYHGKGVEADVDVAKTYLEKAVSFGNKNAKYLLASIYLKEYDYEHIPEAIKWLEESEHPHACYLLGKEYLKGLCVEKDIGKAIHYLKMSAEQKNSFAMYQLAKIFLSEVQHIDPMQAVFYLKEASKLGNESAQITLGQELLKGEIVEKNVEEAVSLLSHAAEKNNMFAQYILGKLFLFGKDVPQDKEKAKEYLELSALQGNEYAKYLLEHMEDYKLQPLAMVGARLFHHVSRIFTQTMPSERSLLGKVDKKLARKIRMKKIAQGHNPKDQGINIS